MPIKHNAWKEDKDLVKQVTNALDLFHIEGSAAKNAFESLIGYVYSSGRLNMMDEITAKREGSYAKLVKESIVLPRQ